MKVNGLKCYIFFGFMSVMLFGCSLDKAQPSSKEIIYKLDDKMIYTIERVIELETMTEEMIGDAETFKVNQGAMAVIRMNRYGHASVGIEKLVWDAYCGVMPLEWVVYMKKNPSWKQSFKEVSWDFNDSITKDAIDFVHLVAVINVFYNETEFDVVKERYYDALLSWGGDLLTMAYAGEPSDNLGTQNVSFFSRDDFLADIDGVNIAQLMKKENLRLSEALKLYYTTTRVQERYQLFKDYYGGEEEAYKFFYEFLLLDGDGSYDLNDFLRTFKSIQDALVLHSLTDSKSLTEEELKQFIEVFIKRLD